MKKIPLMALALLPLGAFAAVEAFGDVPDLKPEVMRVYGLRSAMSLDDVTIKVVLGTATGPGRDKAEAYRIISDDDAEYAYEKFVCPAKIVVAKPPKKEFDIPPGGRPKGAVATLTRAEVVFEVPQPLKKGVRYSVVAQGEKGGGMVTAGLCGASFVHGGAPEIDGDKIAARMTGFRRVTPVGDGKILCEFGHGYSPDGGLKLANWKVTVNGFSSTASSSISRVRFPTATPFRSKSHQPFARASARRRSSSIPPSRFRSQ